MLLDDWFPLAPALKPAQELWRTELLCSLPGQIVEYICRARRPTLVNGLLIVALSCPRQPKAKLHGIHVTDVGILFIG